MRTGGIRLSDREIIELRNLAQRDQSTASYISDAELREFSEDTGLYEVMVSLARQEIIVTRGNPQEYDGEQVCECAWRILQKQRRALGSLRASKRKD